MMISKQNYPVLQGLCRPIDKGFEDYKEHAEQFVLSLNILETVVLLPCCNMHEFVKNTIVNYRHNLNVIPVGDYCLIFIDMYFIVRCTIIDGCKVLAIMECVGGSVDSYYMATVNHFVVDKNGTLLSDESSLSFWGHAINGIYFSCIVSHLMAYVSKGFIRKMTVSPEKTQGVINNCVYTTDFETPVTIFDLKNKYKKQSTAS